MHRSCGIDCDISNVMETNIALDFAFVFHPYAVNELFIFMSNLLPCFHVAV